MIEKKEKVYITRDEESDKVFIWRKPEKGNWSPVQLKNCDMVNYQREDMSHVDYYLISDFKDKFGIKIKEKTRKCVHLSVKILNNEDYKLISNDKKRKR